MSIDTHGNDFVTELLSPEIKNAINILYNLHATPYLHWSRAEDVLFNRDNSRGRKTIIIPDLRVLQVPSYFQESYLRSIDQTLLNKDSITSQPILFIYEFTDHNSLVISKIHISHWCQDKENDDTGEFEDDHYENMDQYLERLVILLNKLTDLKVVNLNFTLDGKSIELLTKNCRYFKISEEAELELYRHRELKLNNSHLSDKLKNNNFKLNIHLEYMVRSMFPWTDPVTGMDRYYQPTPKEEEAWKDLG